MAITGIAMHGGDMDRLITFADTSPGEGEELRQLLRHGAVRVREGRGGGRAGGRAGRRAGTVRAGGQRGASAEKSEALSGKLCVVYPS